MGSYRRIKQLSTKPERRQGYRKSAVRIDHLVADRALTREGFFTLRAYMCGDKLGYVSKDAALDINSSFANRENVYSTRVYHCPFCKCWHRGKDVMTPDVVRRACKLVRHYLRDTHGDVICDADRFDSTGGFGELG